MSATAHTCREGAEAAIDGCGEAASLSVRGWLIAILVAGALVRAMLVWQFGSDPPTIHDARDYDRLAAGLVETGAYVDEAGNLTSLRPPLYAAVAAVLFRAFGEHNYLAVSIFHAGLSLLTVLVAYLLGKEAYSPRVGLGAAAITCFYPTMLAYNQFFLSEVLFTFFVVAGAALSVRMAKSPHPSEALLLGLCLGFGALARSVLWLFAPVLAIGLAIFSQGERRSRWLNAALTLVVFAATIAPWAWRNTKLQQTLTVVDVMGGRNVMMGNYEYTPVDRSWATVELQTGDRAWSSVLADSTEGFEQLTQGQIDKAAMRYGVTYFLTHPTQSLARSTVKFFNYWQLEREIVAGLRQGLFGNTSRAVTLLMAVVVCGAYAATVIGAIFGAIVTPPRPRVVHWTLLAWIAFPCALHTIAFAHSRYHLPFVPILAVYAAAAFAGRSAILDQRGGWRIRLACAASLLLMASWVREFVMVDLKWFV